VRPTSDPPPVPGQPIPSTYPSGEDRPADMRAIYRSEPYHPPGRPSTAAGGRPHPGLEAVGAHHRKRPLPALHVVPAEIEVDRRDRGLDGAPQRPADVGHEGEQVHPRELLRVFPSEVSLAKRSSQVVIESSLLRGVAEVEARVV